MDEHEPTLPPLPNADSSNARPLRPSLLTRKRTYDQSLYDGEPLTATSSDPALFSGDEQDTIGVEDYANKRKKKMYTGSSRSHQLKAGKEDRRKEFKRNYDSGIFMGSDSEPPSSDSITSLEEELIRDQAGALRPKNEDPLFKLGQHLNEDEASTPLAKSRVQQDVGDLDATPRTSLVTTKCEEARLPVTFPAEFDQRRAILQIIQKCLDSGLETVDLSGLSLSDLPPEVAELSCLTKQANFVTGMLENGTSLETHLRLFLGNNFLRRLPLPVLDLTNLRELSLRRNKLTKLPAGIRSLVNLEKLNVSANKLTYLPFEVIDLIAHHRLRELTTEPNLWDTPPHLKSGNEYTTSLQPLNILLRSHMSIHRRLCPVFEAVEAPIAITSPRVASLTEMSLRQLVRARPLEELGQYMPSGTPEIVFDALHVLDEVLQEGGRCCNSCQRAIVLPGREWTEWWIASSSYVPIKRILCSSHCTGTATQWCDKHARP